MRSKCSVDHSYDLHQQDLAITFSTNNKCPAQYWIFNAAACHHQLAHSKLNSVLATHIILFCGLHTFASIVTAASKTRRVWGAGKFMVVEGQVMDSMAWQPQALPCEMSDVAHAIFDGADGLLLGAATSIGITPVQVTTSLPALTSNCMAIAWFQLMTVLKGAATCHAAFKMHGGMLAAWSCDTSL